MSAIRMTHALVQVALAIMTCPDGQLWGYELSKQAGVRSGVLYPILRRMLERGWLEDGWEELDRETSKRPPRRYYTLTENGRRELGAVVATARRDDRFRAVLPRFAQ